MGDYRSLLAFSPSKALWAFIGGSLGTGIGAQLSPGDKLSWGLICAPILLFICIIHLNDDIKNKLGTFRSVTIVALGAMPIWLFAYNVTMDEKENARNPFVLDKLLTKWALDANIRTNHQVAHIDKFSGSMIPPTFMFHMNGYGVEVSLPTNTFVSMVHMSTTASINKEQLDQFYQLSPEGVDRLGFQLNLILKDKVGVQTRIAIPEDPSTPGGFVMAEADVPIDELNSQRLVTEIRLLTGTLDMVASVLYLNLDPNSDGQR
jgi:hypothetical protein